MRTFDEAVARRILGAIHRMARAEASASDAPEPEVVVYDHLPVTDNDEQVTARLHAAFAAEFGDGLVPMTRMSGSEDFSVLPRAFDVPYAFWGFGAFDAQAWEAAQASGEPGAFPVNHSPDFVPVMQPTLDTGTRALVTAALAWLAPAPDDA